MQRLIEKQMVGILKENEAGRGIAHYFEGRASAGGRCAAGRGSTGQVF